MVVVACEVEALGGRRDFQVRHTWRLALVLCTCIPGPFWRGGWREQLPERQMRASAAISRIFIFGRFARLSPDVGPTGDAI